jgi:D-amino peptidase
MKLFISIDQEGASGIFRWGDEKEDAKRMVRDLNIVLGAIKEDEIWSSIESITVADSHAFGRNIPISGIENEKTFLISGNSRTDFMMEGLDSSYDACMFVGYHSRAGEASAILDHTYSSSAVKEVKINGRLCGETEINAYLAGYYEIPLIFASGDDKLQKQIFEFYDEDFPYSLVKYGISKDSAMLLCEQASEDSLVKGVRKAMKLMKIGIHKKYIRKAKNPVKFSIRFKDSLQAYNASIIPFVDLVNGDTLEFVQEDYRDSFRLFEALVALSRV